MKSRQIVGRLRVDNGYLLLKEKVSDDVIYRVRTWPTGVRHNIMWIHTKGILRNG